MARCSKCKPEYVSRITFYRIFRPPGCGTATGRDIHDLKGVLDYLQNRNSDRFHSLANQLTYVKKLADTTSLNTESITNLSSIVINSILQLHDKYQQITRDLFWFNLTNFGQSTT